MNDDKAIVSRITQDNAQLYKIRDDDNVYTKILISKEV